MVVLMNNPSCGLFRILQCSQHGNHPYEDSTKLMIIQRKIVLQFLGKNISNGYESNMMLIQM
jgi:hypothetical protein